MERSFEIESRHDQQRLDVVLAEFLDISRAEACRVLEAGNVQRNGRPVRAKGMTLEIGDRIRVLDFVAEREQSPRPRPDLPLQIVAEGDGWIAVNKSAGVGVHPLRAEQDDTVLNALIARRAELLGVGEAALRSAVVHRLDVETSGVMLFATHQQRWLELRECFAEHRVEKHYRAVVEGHAIVDGELDVSLAVAQSRPARVRVVTRENQGRGLRRCRTVIRTLERGPRRTLVDAAPISGYLHQIRVSLAHAGAPIVGDPLYGGPPAARLFLHATSIRIPSLGIEASEPMPPDFFEEWQA